MQNYIIEKNIGKGSYGNVFVVRSKIDNQLYVLKRVKLTNMNEKEKFSARQEVKLLQTLQHPFIVGYIDSFLDTNGDLCIIMQYCTGGDLSKKLKESGKIKFPEDQIMDWFTQILLAIDFMHQKKVLHRDLKSQNIFLMSNGVVKLGDFGISKILDKTLDMAQTSIGTPLYMSPEVCNNKHYNFKSDVWALGCILYEICTLKPPFDAKDLPTLFLKIIRGIYSPVPYRYSSKLRALVGKMLTTMPNKRPNVRDILSSKFIKSCIIKYILPKLHLFQKQDEAENLKAQLEELNISTMLEQQQHVTPALENPEILERQEAYIRLREYEKDLQKANKALRQLKREKEMRRNKVDERRLRVQKIARQKRERLNALEQRQRDKLRRAEERRANMYKNRLMQMKQKRQNQFRRELKREQVPSEKPAINGEVNYINRDQERIKTLEQEIEQLQKEKHEKELEMMGKEKLLCKQQEAIDEDPNLSQKDKILLKKKLKKEQAEREKKEALLKARRDYYELRLAAKKRNYELYHNHDPFNVNRQIVHNDYQAYVEDSDHDELIREYEERVKKQTKKIEELRKSITQKFGVNSLEELRQQFDEDLFEEEDDEEDEEEELFGEVESIPGKLGERYQYLKNICVSILGYENFERLYKMRKQGSPMKQIQQIIGNKHQAIISFLDDLIFIEDSLT